MEANPVGHVCLPSCQIYIYTPNIILYNILMEDILTTWIGRRKRKREDVGTYVNSKLYLLIGLDPRACRKVVLHFNFEDLESSYYVYIKRGKEYRGNIFSKELLTFSGGYYQLKGGYGARKSGNELIPLHRLLYFSYYDEKNEMLQIHHINGDATDNRIGNLVAISSGDHALLHKHRTISRVRLFY